jgi:NAD(P)-dependent dehydrogenase (short-subunit alcohol dehydrogenase family)
LEAVTLESGDRVVAISGGSKGLGEALACEFLARGFSVGVCARTSVISPAISSIAVRPADTLLVHQCDVSKELEARGFIEALIRRFGRIDVLINNASILGRRSPIENFPSPVWEEVIRVNVNGTFYLSKAVIPIMKESQSGSIINVSSSVGRRGRKTWGAYAVSKFGIEGLTQILADELKPYNIRVNAVNPGAMATVMRAEAFPSEDPATLRRPADVLDVFTFLASDESQNVTGQSFDAQEFIRPALTT